MSWIRAVDNTGAKATMAAAGVAVLIAALTFLNVYHAKAADLEALRVQQVADFGHIETVLEGFITGQFERDIAQLDDKISESESRHDLTLWQRESLARNKARRAMYLRKLERIRRE